MNKRVVLTTVILVLAFTAMLAAQTPPPAPVAPAPAATADTTAPKPLQPVRTETVEPGKVIDGIMAVVDNEIILQSELYQYLQYNVGSQSALEAMRPTQLDSLKQLVLDDLINQKLMLVAARHDTNITVEQKTIDGELDARMKSLIQQSGGQDKLEQYYGMPLAKLKRQFRPLVEEGLLIDKIKRLKTDKIIATSQDVQRFWTMYKDSIPQLKDGIRISHILLQDSISPSSRDAAVKLADSVRKAILDSTITFEDYATKNSADPASAAKGGMLGLTGRGELVPEYEVVAFAMKPGEISAPVVSPFGVHLIRLNERVGEKINTSHILFKVVPTDADRARTQARADSIIDAVKKGADFADLARAYSTDTKTGFKGGDLGWLAPAELPEEFKAPLANLKKGDLASPIRTKFGLHVVLVTDRVFARPITLEEDYDRIARMAQAKKQDEVIGKWLKELAANTYIKRM
jgi:peptidyl-prolyl cis-trans isomerase SurA